MKVYWLENNKGEYYSSCRSFTKNGPPKLYGSEKVLRRSLASSKRWGGDGWTLHPDIIVVQGELNA